MPANAIKRVYEVRCRDGQLNAQQLDTLRKGVKPDAATPRYRPMLVEQMLGFEHSGSGAVSRAQHARRAEWRTRQAEASRRGHKKHAWYRVTVREGRNREIRNAFAAVGCGDIDRLRRTHYGAYRLDDRFKTQALREVKSISPALLLAADAYTHSSSSSSSSNDGDDASADGGKATAAAAAAAKPLSRRARQKEQQQEHHLHTQSSAAAH
jgi:hypothetical protein